MAQLPCIGLCKPCIHLPFGDCAMYLDHGVLYVYMIRKQIHLSRVMSFSG